MLLSEWWTETVIAPLIANWSTPLPLTTNENLVKIYREQGGFLNGAFIDSYLPAQPALLSTVIVLVLLGFVILLITATFCISKCLGLCRLKAHDEETKTRKKLVFCLFLATLSFWMLMAGTWIVYFCFTADFVTENFGGHMIVTDQALTIDTFDQERASRSVEENHIIIGLNSITVRNGNELAEQQSTQTVASPSKAEEHLIALFNNIRELAYEFKPLESDSTNFTMMAFFLFVTVFYLVCLMAGATSAFLSLCQKFRVSQPYNLMETKTDSNTRINYTLHLVGILLLVASPVAHFLATPFIVYSHAHMSICPTEQAVTQNENIELYTNANLKYFEVSSLVDFLNDLRSEQKELNANNCQLSIRHILGLWSSLLAFSWLSIPFAIYLLLLSKYMHNEIVSLEKSHKLNGFSNIGRGYPHVLDNYATIPELVRQRQISATFGTFVHRKY